MAEKDGSLSSPKESAPEAGTPPSNDEGRLSRLEKAMADQASLMLQLTKAVAGYFQKDEDTSNEERPESEEEDSPESKKEREGEVPLEMADLNKDDASSNFGKGPDKDIKVNQPVNPEPAGRKVDDTMIAKMAREVEILKQQVAGVVKSQGGTMIHKAEAEVVGATRAEAGAGQAPKVEDLEKQAKDLSFKELNRMRIEFGDLPQGLI